MGERLTLIGGLGLDEIERASPEQIRDRVRAILDTGKGRLVLSAPPYPVHRISAQLTANYRALIDEAVSYGRTGAPPRSETQPAGST